MFLSIAQKFPYYANYYTHKIISYVCLLPSYVHDI